MNFERSHRILNPFNLKSITTACLTLAAMSGAMFNPTAHGQESPSVNMDQVLVQAQLDLESALEALAKQRNEIVQEKIPLSRELNLAESETLDSRKELQRAQRAQDNQLVELNALKNEVKQRQEQLGYLGSLLNEYARNFETRIHISESQLYDSALNTSKGAFDNAELDPLEKLSAQLELVNASIGRVENAFGGHSFKGQAVTPAGQLEKGSFVVAGPSVYFSSETSDAAGLVDLVLGSPEPTVIDLGAEWKAEIAAFAKSGSGNAPFDPTLGNALKIASTEESFIEHAAKGGPVMIPILALGLFALVVGLIKWIQLSKIRLATPRDLQIILDRVTAGNSDGAKEHAERIHGPVGELLKSAVEHARERKELIEEALYERMLKAKPKLEKLIPFVALGAATAPLLGLLGTVTGMINTFKMISIFGTGDPKTLSSGISEALVTTEFGLIVAIPCLLIHAFLSRKMKNVLGSMEELSVGFINGIPENFESKKNSTPSN